MHLRMILPDNTTPMNFEADPQEFYHTFLYEDNSVQIYVVDGEVETYLLDWIAKKNTGKVIRMKNVQPCSLWNNFSWDGNFKGSVLFADGRREDLETWVNACKGDCTEQDTFDVELVMTPPPVPVEQAPPPVEETVTFDTPGSSTWEQTLQNNFTDSEIAAIQTKNYASLRPKCGWGRTYRDDCFCWRCDSMRRAMASVKPPVPLAPLVWKDLPRGTKIRAFLGETVVGKGRKADDRAYLYEKAGRPLGLGGRYFPFERFTQQFEGEVMIRTEDGRRVIA